MHVLIVGGGIGGLAAALSLHAVGIECTVFEQVRELRELGVGINTLPHAIKELAALGLLPALDRAGIRTRELIYANRFGQVVWRELRGTDAGFDTPQFSIHRGKLHGVLLEAVRERLGDDAVRTGCRLMSFAERGDRIVARFEQREASDAFEVEGDVLVGADGIHSTVRAAFYPDEGPPVWNGMMLWRGAADWPVHVDGRTMVIAGGMGQKFVFYPIHVDPAAPDRRLTNWAVMARIGEGNGFAAAPRGLESPRAVGRDGTVRARSVPARFRRSAGADPGLRDVLRISDVRSRPVAALVVRSRDAAGRCGASDVSGRVERREPGSAGCARAGPASGAAAMCRRRLPAYDAERRPMTAEIVLNNRKGGPERVIDVLEERAPDGFTDVDAVASHAEREAIVRGYASMSGLCPRTGECKCHCEKRSAEAIPIMSA